MSDFKKKKEKKMIALPSTKHAMELVWAAHLSQRFASFLAQNVN